MSGNNKGGASYAANFNSQNMVECFYTENELISEEAQP